jgi:FixJ family two-component response regulator
VIALYCPKGQLDGFASRRKHRRMSGSRPSVAIVDDDPGVLKALARLIAARSFHPCTYKSARDFLESLSHSMPDCLVVDLQMPGMTGLDLQCELGRSGVKIPTVVITAHDEPEFRRQCEAAGAAAYLSKPLDQKALIAAITSAIALREESSAPPLQSGS